MSTSYQSFAEVYDRFMDNIPYVEWADYICKLFSHYGADCGTLVELGCGTGTLCKLMAESGFSVTGIDNSADMLSVARTKIPDSDDIILLQQNMCRLTLPNTSYDGIYSVCDSINYLLYDEELIDTFLGVKKYLRSGGIFIFDLKTIYFYREVLGDKVFCDHQKDCSYTWENSYFAEDNINQYDLTLFIRDESTGLFAKFEETHHQRGYELSKMIDFLDRTGLEYVAAYDAFTMDEPKPDSERIYVIARNGE